MSSSCIGGISTPGFTLGASTIHVARFGGVFAIGRAPIDDPLTEVGQVRADRSVRGRAPNGVAAGARLAHEHRLAFGRGLASRAPTASSSCRVSHRSKSVSVCTIDDEAHARVLDAAELRALADVGARRPRREPQHVVLAGDHVDLAGQLGTQKLWITLSESSPISTGRPAGR